MERRCRGKLHGHAQGARPRRRSSVSFGPDWPEIFDCIRVPRTAAAIERVVRLPQCARGAIAAAAGTTKFRVFPGRGCQNGGRTAAPRRALPETRNQKRKRDDFVSLL
jgi:hypothetical protein